MRRRNAESIGMTTMNKADDVLVPASLDELEDLSVIMDRTKRDFGTKGEHMEIKARMTLTLHCSNLLKPCTATIESGSINIGAGTTTATADAIVKGTRQLKEFAEAEGWTILEEGAWCKECTKLLKAK